VRNAESQNPIRAWTLAGAHPRNTPGESAPRIPRSAFDTTDYPERFMKEPKRTPKPFVLLAVVLLVGSLAAAGWFFFSPKKPADRPFTAEDLAVVCSGRVDAPSMVISLDPHQPGRVAEVLVNEGDEVTPGQPVLKLDDAVAVHRRKQAQSVVTAAEVGREQAKAEAEAFPTQIKIRQATLAAAAVQVAAADKELNDLRPNQSQSKAVAAKVAELEATLGRYKQLQKAEQLAVEQMEKADRDKFPLLAVTAAEARLAAAKADLELAERAEKECTIVAPARGHILRLQAAKGGGIAPGYMPAIVFAPSGRRIVRAEVEQEYLGRVKVGQSVQMKDDTRPDSPKWTGKVVGVSRWVAQRRTLILEPGEINDVRTLEAVIEPDDDDGLVIGQRMRITIITK
jgi:multidrug resistance efflux pump